MTEFGEWQKCPVCEGTSKLTIQFHDGLSVVDWKCKVCGGKGVLARPVIPEKKVLQNKRRGIESTKG